MVRHRIRSAQSSRCCPARLGRTPVASWKKSRLSKLDCHQCCHLSGRLPMACRRECSWHPVTGWRCRWVSGAWSGWYGMRTSEVPAGQTVSAAKLKYVAAKLDAPRMREPLRRVIDWVAAYTLSPHGLVLRMAVHMPALSQPDSPRTAFRSAAALPDGVRVTAARQKVLDAATSSPLTARALAAAAGVSDAVVRAMADAGLLVRVALPPATPPEPDPSLPGPSLSAEQQTAASELIEAVRRAAL